MRPPDMAFRGAPAAGAPNLRSVAERLGARLVKISCDEYAGPCPRCGGRDAFAVNTRRGLFICRKAGCGGDAIALARHVMDVSFQEARAFLGGAVGKLQASSISITGASPLGSPPMRPVSQWAPPAPNQKARRLFDAAHPIAATQAEAYLAARGLCLSPEEKTNLRFIPSLAYWGFENSSATHVSNMGYFPAMIAAIRNAEADIIGAHRTYLEQHAPRKLHPPGDRTRNSVKKILGAQRGGLIWLSTKAAEILAIGEGIETSLAWRRFLPSSKAYALCAAASLGNLAGPADCSAPGLIAPPNTRVVILLGDGDSDPIRTRTALLKAGARFRAQGKTVSIHMAPPGHDWASALAFRAGPDAASLPPL